MSNVAKNVIFNVVGQGLVMVVTFVAVRLIFRSLGEDVFGIIYLNITLTTVIATVLELGVLSTTMREVSRFFESERPYIIELIQTATLIYWALGVATVCLVFLVAPFLARSWLHLSTLDPGRAITLIRILSIGMLVTLPRALYTSLFRGRQRMAINNGIDVATAVVQQFGIVILLRLGATADVVAVWISTTLLMAICVYLVVVGRMFGVRSLLPRWHPSVVRRNARYTTQMMSNSLLSLTHTQADKVLASKLLTAAAFGLYGFASGAIGRGTFVSIAIGQAAFSSFAKLAADGDMDGVRRQFRKLQDLACFSAAAMFAVAALGVLPLYVYLFGPGAARQLLVPTIVLLVAFYIYATLIQPSMLAFALGHPGVVVRANVIALFLLLPVAAVLVAAFAMTGAAISWLLYNLYLALVTLPRIAADCLHIRPWGWYGRMLAPAGLALIAYGASWVAIGLPMKMSWIAIVMAALAGTVAYVGGAYVLIDRELRDSVGALVGSVAMRIMGPHPVS